MSEQDSKSTSTPSRLGVQHITPFTAGNLLGPDLKAACQVDDVAEVARLTVDASKDLWSTVLQVAGTVSAMEVVKLAVRYGGRLNCNSSFYVVVSRQGEAAFRYLVECGELEADADLDRAGCPLDWAVSGNRPAMVRFLLSRGATPHGSVECRGGITTLECAAQDADVEMVQLLLDYGVAMPNNGPLVLAAGAGRVATVELLLGQGADINELGVIRRDERCLIDLETPLHRAVRKGHTEVIATLLNAGADINVRNARGQTVVELAKACGMDDMFAQPIITEKLDMILKLEAEVQVSI